MAFVPEDCVGEITLLMALRLCNGREDKHCQPGDGDGKERPVSDGSDWLFEH